jgi:hypothetical protein
MAIQTFKFHLGIDRKRSTGNYWLRRDAFFQVAHYSLLFHRSGAIKMISYLWVVETEQNMVI